MTLKQQRQLLPLLLLTVYCIDAVFTAMGGAVAMAGETYEITLTIKHYMAFGAVTINFLTYFLLRQYYRYTLPFTVIVGFFGLITFSAFETTITYSLSSLKIGFQPSAFWAGLLAYIHNHYF